MPAISRTYPRTIFKAEVLQEAMALMERMDNEHFEKLDAETAKRRKDQYRHRAHSLTRQQDQWEFDSIEEFYSEYRKGFRHAQLLWNLAHISMRLNGWSNATGTDVYSVVYIEGASNPEVLRVLEVFDRHASGCYIPAPEVTVQPPVIFIGHGRNAQWRDLKDHLHEQHKYDIQAYEVGARAGHAIRDILAEMVRGSSFAVIVMTGEDETATGNFNPRLNVVHELGLFQGALGFSRAIVLLEEGTEEFSNIHGIQQIRFKKGNIRETYGDVLATLRREFQK